MKNRYRMLPIILATAGLAAACSPGYDRAESIDDFVEAGLTTEQATCVIDGLEQQIGEDRLGERGDLTADEETIVTDVTFECVLGS